MNKHEAVIFLFSIAKEIERSFDSPVILFTEKDYADYVFNALVDIRSALLGNSTPNQVAAIVKTFHTEWLNAIRDIETFKKRLRDIPRETIYKAIEFSIECTQSRYKHFEKYIENLQSAMTQDEKSVLLANLEIIKDMHEMVRSALLEKQEYLRFQADQAEYYDRLEDEIEELMNWIDKLNDNLSIQFSKILDLRVPLATSELTKTLKDIINEVAENPDPEAQKISKEIQSKGKLLSSVIRVSCYSELEMKKVVEKINILEERISRLEGENSSAVLALQHRSIYLEERLQSLENMKNSMKRLRAISDTYAYQDCISYVEIHIFNHLLPHPERCRLVEQLLTRWNNAIGLEKAEESIISILSVTDLKEVFSDEIGHFTVDKYGRKIYTRDNDSQFYQLNEHNRLVTVKDDEKHVYFYDECGRYYFDTFRQRIYKAHPKASEYVLDRDGVLLKIREEREGIQYSYDNLGRYYINNLGHHIYRTEDSDSEYENDGFGNLIKIRADSEYEIIESQPVAMPVRKYLMQTVGRALKKCITDVILHQPQDPIAYLASSLEKYRQDIHMAQKQVEERKALSAERLERKAMDKPTTPNQSYREEVFTDFSYSDDLYIRLSMNMAEESEM